MTMIPVYIFTMLCFIITMLFIIFGKLTAKQYSTWAANSYLTFATALMIPCGHVEWMIYIIQCADILLFNEIENQWTVHVLACIPVVS